MLCCVSPIIFNYTYYILHISIFTYYIRVTIDFDTEQKMYFYTDARALAGEEEAPPRSIDSVLIILDDHAEEDEESICIIDEQPVTITISREDCILRR